MVLIALRALCLSEAMIYWLISLPTRRHIALDLAGADVHDLDLDVFGGDAGREVVADCREVVALNGGFAVVDAALLALLLFIELFELLFGYHDIFFVVGTAEVLYPKV